MAEMYLEQACRNITGYSPLPFKLAREWFVRPVSIEDANLVIEPDEDEAEYLETAEEAI